MASDLLSWQDKTDKRVNKETDADFIAKHGDLRPTLAAHEQHVLSSFEAETIPSIVSLFVGPTVL